MFTMERHTERRQEESSFLVVCRSRTYEDVDSGDHFGGVAVYIKLSLAKPAFNTQQGKSQKSHHLIATK